MKPFQISAPAAAELAVGVSWYEAKRAGLGGVLRPGRLAHRRLSMARFPYTIIYRVRETDVYIVAIAHTSRRPDYWKNRD